MSAKVRVKICGITNTEDAKIASQAGVDAIGIVFYAKSPRHVEDLKIARNIALAVEPFVNVVGLFVDADPSVVKAILSQVPLSTLQFHGDESAEYCEQFDRPYLKALRMRPNIDLYALCKTYKSASGLLLDTYKKGLPGGTGESFDWDSVPHDLPKPIVLAGGLRPDNVMQCIEQTQPSAIDVSGGVESTKGKKDADKIAAFLSAML